MAGDVARCPSVTAAVERLLDHALDTGLLEELDLRWARNRILEDCGLFGVSEDLPAHEGLPLEEALELIAEQGVRAGLAQDSAGGRERIRTRVMGELLPRPSDLSARFWGLHGRAGARAATSWLYRLCCAADYVRTSAIARNICWEQPSRWGDMEITINMSKPEKDPRDIAAASVAPVGATYPACQLCRENEGYSGRPASLSGGHPARQNLRIIPLELGGEAWGLQYSPYAYFTEHCIVMSDEHRPMHIDMAAVSRLVDFVEQFPHYFVGSNADLPIVGGSILSHDHFQGGAHEFAMAHAGVSERFSLAGLEEVEAEVLAWPLSVIRLRSGGRAALLAAAARVMGAWERWSDEELGIRAEDPDGTRHNTVTPICRRRGQDFELDLALRCNVTSGEHPLGVFHPHEDKWHVKKENIGLIEVMGLAILPPRLEKDMREGRIDRDEIGRTFVAALEDAGVFKWDEAGRAGLRRFLDAL